MQAELKQAENQWRQAADESLAKANSDIAELKRTLAKRNAELAAASAGASVPSDAIRWGGHAYYFVSDAVTQQDAANKCRDMGGYLARIETADEHQLVMTAFRELAQADAGNTDPRFWIDGSDRSKEGEWRLSNGSLIQFLGWRQGEPNSEGEDEDGVQIMTGGWNDISMARQCGFVCEWDGLQSSGQTTIEAAVAGFLPAWEQRIYLQTADRVPKSDGVLPSSRNSANLNDPRNWIVSKGTWSFTKSGQLHGEGDSGIRFRRTLPWPTELSFKMRVLNGMRPRVALGGTEIYFGNEGYEPTIWLYGNVKDLTGSPFRYKPNTTYDVTVRASKEFLRLLIDGKDVGATAIEKRPDSVALELSGGDGWSPGVTEFWDFKITPTKTMPIQESAGSDRGPAVGSTYEQDDTALYLSWGQESVVPGRGAKQIMNGKIRERFGDQYGEWIDLRVVSDDLQESFISGLGHIQYQNGRLREVFEDQYGEWIDITIVDDKLQESVVSGRGHFQYQNGRLREVFEDQYGQWITIRETARKQ